MRFARLLKGWQLAALRGWTTGKWKWDSNLVGGRHPSKPSQVVEVALPDCRTAEVIRLGNCYLPTGIVMDALVLAVQWGFLTEAAPWTSGGGTM